MLEIRNGGFDMKKTIITLVLLIVLIVCLVAVAGIHNDKDQSDDISRGESDASSSSHVSDDGSMPETPSTPDTSFATGDDSDANGEASDELPTEHVLGWQYLSDKSKYVLTVDGSAMSDELWDYIMNDLEVDGREAVFARKGGDYYFIYTDLSRQKAAFEPWTVYSTGEITVTCELSHFTDNEGYECIGEPRPYIYKIVKDGKTIADSELKPVIFKDYVIINPIIVGVGDVAFGLNAQIYSSSGILVSDDHGVAYADERSDYLVTYDEKLVEDDNGGYFIDGIPHRLETFHSVLSADLETVYTSKSTVKFDELGGLCVYDDQAKKYVPIEIN